MSPVQPTKSAYRTVQPQAPSKQPQTPHIPGSTGLGTTKSPTTRLSEYVSYQAHLATLLICPLRPGSALRPRTRFAPTGPPRAVLLRGRVLRRPRCGPTHSLRSWAGPPRGTPPHPARWPSAARHQPDAACAWGPLRFARGGLLLFGCSLPVRHERRPRAKRSGPTRRASTPLARFKRLATELARRRASAEARPSSEARWLGRSGGRRRAPSAPPGRSGPGQTFPHDQTRRPSNSTRPRRPERRARTERTRSNLPARPNQTTFKQHAPPEAGAPRPDRADQVKPSAPRGSAPSPHEASTPFVTFKCDATALVRTERTSGHSNYEPGVLKSSGEIVSRNSRNFSSSFSCSCSCSSGTVMPASASTASTP